MLFRPFVVVLALVATGASAAHAAPPSATPATAPAPASPEPAYDPRGLGVIVSGGVSANLPLSFSAEASAGWVPIAPLGIIVRTSVNAAERDGWADVQLGVRWWPARAERPGLSFELHGGRANVSEEYDCIGTRPEDVRCTGGEATGTSYGGTLRAALVRGRHASLDLAVSLDVVHFRDASMDVPNSWSALRFGLGLSFY